MAMSMAERKKKLAERKKKQDEILKKVIEEVFEIDVDEVERKKTKREIIDDIFVGDIREEGFLLDGEQQKTNDRYETGEERENRVINSIFEDEDFEGDTKSFYDCAEEEYSAEEDDNEELEELTEDMVEELEASDYKYYSNLMEDDIILNDEHEEVY